MTRKIFICSFIFLMIFLTSFSQALAFWPTFDVVGAVPSWVTSIEAAPPAVSTPVDAAVNTGSFATNVASHVKTFVLDPLAVAVARGMVRMITAQTVSWINSGFKGNPAFLTNPDQFFLNVADNTAARFVSQNGVLSQLCSPFQAKVRMALVKAYLGPEQPFACGLDTLKNNYEAFTRDFSQGGWEGWFEMTQNEMNNPYGAFLNTQDSLSAQIGNQKINKQKQLDWGRGFMSWNKCIRSANTNTGPGVIGASASGGPGATQGATRQYCKAYSELTIGDSSGPTCKEWVTQIQDADGNWHEVNGEGQNFQNDLGCPVGYVPDETGMCVDSSGNPPPSADDTDDGTQEGDCAQTETVTPGSLIETQLEKLFGSDISQLEVTNSINQIVSALMTQLVSTAVRGVGGGLRSISKPGTAGTGRTLLQEMNNNSPEVQAENAAIEKNIRSTVLPELNGTSTQAAANDIFWVPPTDGELKAKTDRLSGSAPAPSDENSGSVTCTTIGNQMTCDQ